MKIVEFGLGFRRLLNFPFISDRKHFFLMKTKIEVS